MLRALLEDRRARVHHYGRQLRRGPERRPRGRGDEAEGEHELEFGQGSVLWGGGGPFWFFAFFVCGVPCGVLWRASDSGRVAKDVLVSPGRLELSVASAALGGGARRLRATEWLRERRRRPGAPRLASSALPVAPFEPSELDVSVRRDVALLSRRCNSSETMRVGGAVLAGCSLAPFRIARQLPALSQLNFRTSRTT